MPPRRSSPGPIVLLALAAGPLAAGACGGGTKKPDGAGGFGGFGGGAQQDAKGGAGGGIGGSGGGGGAGGGSTDAGAKPDLPPDLPPENEEKKGFDLPQAGSRFVYVANPKRDSVAVIDSQTLTIKTVEAGDSPTYLATVPGKDVALVINVGSKDVTIVRADTSGSKVSTVPVVAGANSLSVSPDGKHVIAWIDSSVKGTSAKSLQDISLVRLDDGGDVSIALSVGFRPIEVEFAADGSAGFVVTEDGVSIVRFADIKGPAIAPTIGLGDDGKIPVSRDVSITPNGRYALARREMETTVRLVDLGSGAIQTFDAGAKVTDLDLAPDGSFTLAVLREAFAVVRIPIPGGFDDAKAALRIDTGTEIVGSAALVPDGANALLYTTAFTPPIERIVILPLAGGPLRPIKLKKAVRAIALSPDSKKALIIHNKVAGDPNDPSIDLETRIDRSWGYSLLDIGAGFAKLQLTAADPGPLVVVPDASKAFVLLRDDAASLRVAQRIDLGSFVVDDFPLGSPPVSIGAVPGAHRVFVGQSHPEGRLSFIDWETGEIASVTGFELNGKIVE